MLPSRRSHALVRWIALLALLGSLALAGIAAGKPGAAARPGGTRAALLERGLYLTTIMGCNDCHTPGTLFGAPDFERRLSGSELGCAGRGASRSPAT